MKSNQDNTQSTFWNDPVNTWFQKFHSSPNGLSEQQALEHLLDSGVHLKKAHKFKKIIFLFLRQFKSPLMLMLIGAIIISSFLGDTSDVSIISFIVASTGLMSFFQERNAGKIVEKLQALISIKTTVLRDGEEKILASKFIIPGDILILKAGDIIPADALIFEANELYVNESSLTGESFPIKKQIQITAADTPLSKRFNCLWEGTNIISGNAKALVIQTGDQTIFGKIKESSDTPIETTYERGIKDFGFFLMKITIVLSSFVLLVNLLNHTGIIEAAMFSLALAIGMAPELLPAINTIAMSAGAKRLLEKKVIVKKLNSIQNLGEVDLLCTDKTGTITMGEISISKMVNGEGNEDPLLQQLAFWNASFESGYANPIDTAIKNLNFQLPPQLIKIGEIPYDFHRKRLSIAVENDLERIIISKGSFNSIRGICTQIKLSNGNVEKIDQYDDIIHQLYADYGEEGNRVIAVGYKILSKSEIQITDEMDLIFAGFILMNDPIKPSIPDALVKLKNLNVGLKIITGDNLNIAHSIAHQVGFPAPTIMTGKELNSLSAEALTVRIKDVDVFAEVEPQQKERIILALKKNFSVAYMGDGINDVSALHAADVGISVSNAVDVAREAADFVLTENDLSVVIDGIQEGRKTFANTLKYIYINTGSTFGNMFSMAIASLILPFLPMLPKQILLTNFLTDFPFLSVSADNVDDDQIKQPGKWNIKSVRSYMIIFGLHSTIFDVTTFLTLYYFLKCQESAFQTGWFIESIVTELLILFVIRTRKSFIKSKPGKYLFVISAIALVLTVSLPYFPFASDLGFVALPLGYIILLFGIILTYIITADLIKIWFFKTKF
jgi:Mg2+-importing ATPase